jgi:hypothetical protein
MNLEKRVEKLEQSMGSTDEFLLVVVVPMGVNPDKMGPERIVQREMTGYRSCGSVDRSWTRGQNESVESFQARVEQELRAEGRKSHIVCETYAEDAA